MSRILFVWTVFVITHSLIKSALIEYPANKYIEERQRTDLNDINPIFRYYITPREIQFNANVIKDGLPYFLRCKGSKTAIKFTVPPSAVEYLSIDTDHKTHTITARLLENQLTSDLVGRYTCSEKVNNKDQETTVHVFIQNERSVFTKKIYSKVFKQTGIHFFNIPCQTNNWYARISCPISSNSKQCKLPSCNSRERQTNELKCNTPVCNEQDLCIPVYYTPSNLKAENVFFDPQIGFALENPTISDRLNQFTCMSNYTPNQESRIPFDSSQPEYIKIHQQSFTVLKDESVQLTCDIQYPIKIGQQKPRIFWFEDIHNLQLISNETQPNIYDHETGLYSQSSTLILNGFQPGQVYRFYCVRESKNGLYSRSVDIICAKAPSLDLAINPSSTTTGDKIPYGSNGVYDINVLTVPRSDIQIDILRDGISFPNERYKMSIITNRENRLWEYTLTIYNMTFEDEVDFKVIAKSSVVEKSEIIKPKITGNPVGEFTFIPNQIPHSIPWRNDQSKIYSYGIHPRERYRILCNVRHRSEKKQSLNVFIQYYQCSIDNCLSDLLDKACRSSSDQNSIGTIAHRIDKFQTQFVSSDSHKLDNPSMGHQYLCCYQQNGLINIAKAITILSQNRSMFVITKPEYGLVTSDILTYRCEAHQLIYDDLQIIYNDGLLTYERNLADRTWRLKNNRQVQQLDINWNSSIKYLTEIRSMAIEVKTPPLTKIRNNGYFQCIARSKRLDVIPNANDTYVINVGDLIPLTFKNNFQQVSRLNRKAGDYVKFDCTFNGRPKPKLFWLKGKLLFNSSESTLQFEDDNASLRTNRAQASDTGYFTCILNNGHGDTLQRSFDLRVQGTNPYSRFGRLTSLIVIVFFFLLLLMLIILILFGIKYLKMTKHVKAGPYHGKKPSEIPDETQPALGQLARIPLPDNFASQHQIDAFLNFVNGKTIPNVKDDFKELGHGQFGVVYQVRLPDVGLVAAKILPETIRHTKRQRDKRKESDDLEENKEMISKHEYRKRKAVDMLIDEMKVMHRAGKHVNIVALKKVAYPEARFKLLFTGGPIEYEDSFYLMELCLNGSLESMLKRFIQPSSNRSNEKLSLYETLSNRPKSEMTVAEAYEQCLLTDDDLKLIAYQVACGADYLNRRQIAHCDIAPRNVLVTSRFIMKICDFGLATWTTYKNYREQLAQNDNVQLEKKNDEIATHNLTPELARDFLRASISNEQSILNKLSIKSDVWSFGIFLWTLFLKCRIRPFSKLLEEMERTSDSENFFHRLARIISDGHVLRYINYQPEIPRDIYGIIRDCLVEETHRPEMTRIRAYLCHSDILSKQAFEYYRSEYNQYQEENTPDGNVELFAEVQGVRAIPLFEGSKSTYESLPHHDNVEFRPTTNNELYYPETAGDTYLPPKKAPSPPTTTTEANLPKVHTKKRAPIKANKKDDSYL